MYAILKNLNVLNMKLHIIPLKLRLSDVPSLASVAGVASVPGIFGVASSPTASSPKHVYLMIPSSTFNRFEDFGFQASLNFLTSFAFSCAYKISACGRSAMPVKSTRHPRPMANCLPNIDLLLHG